MLTAEDKKIFKAEVRKANPIEILTIAEFIKKSKLLSKEDKSFCFSCIGMRSEKLLRNVVNNMSFDD